MQVPAGTVFADLTVIQEVERSGPNRRFLCRCVCGKESVKFLGNLRLGRSTSCGCLTKMGEAGRAAVLASRRAKSQESDEGRICLTCQTWKRWEHFKPDPRKTRGKGSNCNECARWRRMRLVCGISRAEWELLRDSQGGGCAICGDRNPGVRGLCVDHDHACCGKERACKSCIRGLLCDFCNRVLGRIEQKPELAERFTDYLQRRPLAQ